MKRSKAAFQNSEHPYSKVVAASAVPVGGLSDGPSRLELISLALILILAAAARLPFLSTVPPAMNQDEVGRAYDAWCLWETGADQHGVKLPVLLRQFGPGDYSGALDAYLIAPFVGLLGPSPQAARLPLAVVGIAGVALLWWWARREFDPLTAGAAALVLALSPCHIQQSRLCVDVILVPTLITGGLAALSAAGFRARPSETPLRWRWMALAGVLFAAATYSYISARAAIPFTLLALLACFPRRIARLLTDGPGRIAVGAFVLGLLAAMVPFFVTLAAHPDQVFGRAAHVSILSREAVPGSRAYEFVKNYAAHLDPRFLFLTGEKSPIDAIPGLGMLPWYGLILVPLGIVAAALMARANGMAKWSLIWLLVAPMAAALSVTGIPHAFRSNPMLPPLALLAGLGVSWVSAFLSRRGRLLRTSVAIAALAIVAVTAVRHAQWYFGRVPEAYKADYQGDAVEAFRLLTRPGEKFDHCIVTPAINQPYIYLLYFGRIPPQQWQRAHVARLPWGYQGMEMVPRYGEYYFLPKDEPEVLSDTIRRLGESWPAGQRVLFLIRPGEMDRGRLLRTFGPAGKPTLELREVHPEELR